MGLTITGGINFGSGFALISPGGGGGGVGPYWMSTLSNLTYSEAGNGITTDSTGNIFVTGYAWGGGSQYDQVIIKLNTSAGIVWKYTYGVNTTDIGYSVAVAASGNVVLAGSTVSASSGTDTTLILLDSTGSSVYQRVLPSAAADPDSAYSVKTDSSSNVYITGLYTLSSVKSVSVYKFNTIGDVVFRKKLTGGAASEGRGICVDSSNNSYICGNTTVGSVTNLLVVKLNTTGNILWQKTLGSTGGGTGRGAVLDSSGNIYVCGWDGTTQAAIVAKYNSSGTLLWQRQISGAANSGYTSIAIDSNNNIYLTGYAVSAAGINALPVVKYNSSGTLQWKRIISSLNHTTGYGITIDNNNDIIVTGSVYPITSHTDMLVVKLPPDGSKTGTYTVGGINLTYADWTNAESASSLTDGTPNLTVTTLTDSVYSGALSKTTTVLTSSVTNL